VTANPSTGKLLRVLGLGFGIAVLVGNTIGSGILRTPGEVAGYLPSAALFLGVWVAGGIYALLGSNALAEVAAMTRESGGYTVFVRRGLGPYLGFVAGWSDWISSCSSATAAAIVIGESVRILAGTAPPTIFAFAGAVLLAFTFIQWRGVRSASRTQNLTSLLKAVAFLAFVAICFAYGGARSATGSAPMEASNLPFLIGLILAMQAVIFTFDGWIGPAYFAGELRDPGRQLPRSIFGGVIAVIVIYLLVNLALLHVLPINKLAHDPFAAGSAMAAIFGPRGDTAIRVLVVLGLLSAINAYLMFTSRTFYALSGQVGFPAGQRVNTGGTPTTGLLVSAAAATLFLVGGTYQRVIAITAFLFVANYTFLYLSLFALRYREPDAPRPYRAWGHPWSTGFVLLISIAFLVGALMTDTRNSLASLALLLLSYPVFRALRKRAGR
jgi:APA family basic amino acid/polyamine antiporter